MVAGNWGFASHITKEEISVQAAKQKAYAQEIREGQHLPTILQRLNYYATGECLALLP